MVKSRVETRNIFLSARNGKINMKRLVHSVVGMPYAFLYNMRMPNTQQVLQPSWLLVEIKL